MRSLDLLWRRFDVHNCGAGERRLARPLAMLLILLTGVVHAALPSPLTHGAVGNGVADDTAAIVAALAAGGTVGLLGESYRITQSINVPAGAKIVGPGTIIVDYDAYNQTAQNNALNLAGDHIELRNFKLTKRFTQGSWAVGIGALNRKDIRLQNLEITGYSAGAGIRMQGCSELLLDALVIRNFRLDWIRNLSTVPAAGIVLLDCTVASIQRCHIDHIEIAANVRAFAPAGQPQGYTSAGIYLSNTRGVTIEACNLFVLGRGIEAVDTQNSVIMGNTLRDIWGSGITLRRSSYNVVMSNQLNSCGQGILVQGSDTSSPITNPGPQTSNGNTLKANQLLNIGAPGYFGMDVSARGLAVTGGINQLTGHTYNLTNDHVLARTPDYPTGAITLVFDGSTLNSQLADNIGISTTIGLAQAEVLPIAAPNPPTTPISVKNSVQNWTLFN